MKKILMIAAAFLLASCASSGPPTTNEPVEESSSLSRGDIEITVSNVDASEIYLSGSFNGWALDEDPFFQNEEGDWELTKFFRSGKHQFKLIIDGEWITPDTGLIIDPRPTDFIDDGFGGLNAVYEVR